MAWASERLHAFKSATVAACLMVESLLFFPTLLAAVVGVVVAATRRVRSVLPRLGEGASKGPAAAPSVAHSIESFAVD